MHNLYSGTLP